MNGFAPNLIQTPRTRSLDSLCPQNSYPTKSKMAAAAVLKITFLAITRPFLDAFGPNLKLGSKWGPTVRFTAKIHIVQKSKMAAAAILKSVKLP